MIVKYADELTTFYQGKAEDFLNQHDGEIDLLLIDPPYGLDMTTISSSKSKSKKAKAVEYTQHEWLKKGLAKQNTIYSLIGLSNHAIIWGGNYYDLPPSSCWFVWNKETQCEYADSILAWSNLPGVVKKIDWLWNGMCKQSPEQRFHPTQMPEAIINFCLDQFEAKVKRKPRLVLDCYAGSGTTLVACRKRGINCIGVEEVEEYCQGALTRLSQGVLNYG